MPFSDPIVAGETLVRNAIQSEPYQTGVIGWRIERDGDVEFNDATIRGALVVNDGIRSITIDTPGSLAQILFEILGTAIGRISINSSVSPAGLNFDGIFNGVTTASLRLVPGSNFLNLYATNGTATQDSWLFIQANQNSRVSRPIVATDNNGGTIPESWHDVSFQNGWSNFGSGYSNAQYRRMPDGTIRLRGTPTAGTKTDGTTIATLPVGYRPPATKQLRVPNSNNGSCLIEILTNGIIRVFFMGASNAIVWDGITFELSTI